jgi:hypothetical protein
MSAVDGRSSPDEGFDSTALDGTLGEVVGGEVLRVRRRFSQFRVGLLTIPPFFSNKEAELNDGAFAESMGLVTLHQLLAEGSYQFC